MNFRPLNWRWDIIESHTRKLALNYLITIKAKEKCNKNNEIISINYHRVRWKLKMVYDCDCVVFCIHQSLNWVEKERFRLLRAYCISFLLLYTIRSLGGMVWVVVALRSVRWPIFLCVFLLVSHLVTHSPRYSKICSGILTVTVSKCIKNVYANRTRHICLFVEWIKKRWIEGIQDNLTKTQNNWSVIH